MDCNKVQVKSLFCNILMTPKKSVVYNKPENKMTKAEKLKWLSKNRYR